MKKLAAFCAAMIILSGMAAPAHAESVTGPDYIADITSDIHVNMLDPEALLPFDVIIDAENNIISKVYYLAESDDPGKISIEGFVRDGWNYGVVDVLKQEIESTESREHTEIVTENSDKNDTASVLSVLPKTKDFVTEDGLSGVLTLNTNSVTTEVSGYGSYSKEITATRSYPNLSDADTAFIPKTIEDNGKTLQLADVSWSSSTAGDIPDEMSTRYTATATYSGTKAGSYIKGYVVTAEYTGTVSRHAQSNTKYTVIFTGTEIVPEPTPDTEPIQEAQDNDKTPVLTYLFIPVVILALIAGAVLGKYIKRSTNNETEQLDSNSNDVIDLTDDDIEYPGIGE